MRRRIRSARFLILPAFAALLLASLLGVPAAAGAQARPGASTDRAGRSTTVDVPVSFAVRNVNRSRVACAADGRKYTVRGHLVVPGTDVAPRQPTHNRAVTLYLHGLSFGEFFWNFRDVHGYDYARKLAARGQTSLIIDRLGYGSSDKPNGFGICAGSRADIAHQMIKDLRSGHYGSASDSPRFGKVFLAGHSYGGQIAQVEAYSFGDIDGLVVISYSDVGQTALLRKNAASASRVCNAGGQRVSPSGPGGYAPFGPPSGAPAALFHDVSPRVLHAAVPKLTVDPCGDDASFNHATATDLSNLHRIHVPVLLVQGGADALFAAHAQQAQAALFLHARYISTAVIADTAHAVTLERTRTQFANVMAYTLTRFEYDRS